MDGESICPETLDRDGKPYRSIWNVSDRLFPNSARNYSMSYGDFLRPLSRRQGGYAERSC